MVWWETGPGCGLLSFVSSVFVSKQVPSFFPPSERTMCDDENCEDDEERRTGACLPTFILFKAGAFLAVSAYILAQVNMYWSGVNELPFVGQILNAVLKIIELFASPADPFLPLWVLYYFLVTLVSCSSIEIAAAIFALGYTLCPCNGWESQQFHYAVWVILVIVQIPSFLLLTFLSLAVAIVSIVAWATSVAGSSSGLASVALILFFCFAMPVMIIGCVSCCGACSRARQARPRRRRRHRHYHRYSQKSLHEHHQHIIVSPISSSSTDDNDHRCKDPNCNHYSKLNLAQEDSSTWTTEE